ncbi:MAG: hypothetical protein ACREAT_05255, partial [Nitrosotalea sp.]
MSSKSSIFFSGPEQKLNPGFSVQIFTLKNIVKYHHHIYAGKIQKLDMVSPYKPRGFGLKMGKKCSKTHSDNPLKVLLMLPHGWNCSICFKISNVVLSLLFTIVANSNPILTDSGVR